ncbi:hypothetical protein LTS18_005499, partial [Coniosporium uncinatum]
MATPATSSTPCANNTYAGGSVSPATEITQANMNTASASPSNNHTVASVAGLDGQSPMLAMTENDSSSASTTCAFDNHNCPLKRNASETGVYRAVVSHFFGRNTTDVRVLKQFDLNPVLCRKHYQRKSYTPVHQTLDQRLAWAKERCDNFIKKTMDNIEARFPGTTYKIALKESERKRQQISRAAPKSVGENGSRSDTTSANFEAPLAVLDNIATNYVGSGRNVSFCKAAVDHIYQLVEQETCNDLVVVQFCPTFDKDQIAAAEATVQQQVPAFATSHQSTSPAGPISPTTALTAAVQYGLPVFVPSNPLAAAT